MNSNSPSCIIPTISVDSPKKRRPIQPINHKKKATLQQSNNDLKIPIWSLSINTKNNPNKTKPANI